MNSAHSKVKKSTVTKLVSHFFYVLIFITDTTVITYKC